MTERERLQTEHREGIRELLGTVSYTCTGGSPKVNQLCEDAYELMHRIDLKGTKHGDTEKALGIVSEIDRTWAWHKWNYTVRECLQRHADNNQRWDTTQYRKALAWLKANS